VAGVFTVSPEKLAVNLSCCSFLLKISFQIYLIGVLPWLYSVRGMLSSFFTFIWVCYFLIQNDVPSDMLFCMIACALQGQRYFFIKMKISEVLSFEYRIRPVDFAFQEISKTLSAPLIS